MRAVAAVVVSLFFILGHASLAQNLVIAPTTTLAAETGNNTSAADSFASQTNGNVGAGNISKLPLASLLYPGANTHIYAHFMPWFSGANHMNVGYSSDDAAQVRRQVDDMISRGIAGLIVDWYGPTFTRENQTTILAQHEAELRGGAFVFAVTEDVGALNSCASTVGCDVTAQLISDLTYAYNTFENSPAYMRINGRPAVFFFGLEKYAIDWVRARAGVPGNPLFIFRNSGAFALTYSDGGFSWVALSSDPLNMGLSYLDDFYSKGLPLAQQQTFGSAYKGFNDSLASWAPTPPRVLGQQCGATWLATFAETAKFYSPNNQLPWLQLVTWNDYEEGSEIESGIDNCVTVAASVSGSTLSWSMSGSQATVDHFTVFLSSDGQGLMSLGDVAADGRSLDLGPLHVPPGNYSLFVKAVGKPSMRNQMSGGVPFSVASPPPAAASDVALAAAPSTVTLGRGQSGVVNVSVAPTTGSFNGTVTLACQNLPQLATCSFSPATVVPGGTAAKTSLTIATSTATARLHPSGAPVFAFWFGGSPALGLMGMVLAGRPAGKRRQRGMWLSILLVLGLAMLLAGCGGGGMRSPVAPAAGVSGTPPGTYSVTVVATSGAVQRTTTVTLVVQ